MLGRDAVNFGHVGSDGGALEGRQALRGDAQGIAEGQSDAFFP
jgi:hypothetical protein